MYGLGVNRLGVTKTSEAFEWEPTNLFANSEQGAWYDPSDLTTLFQNSNGTTAVAVGDPVGYIADKSGNTNHAIQATSDRRPVLREAGGLYYLEFDGANSCLATSAIDFSGGDQMSLSTGARKEGSSNQMIAELSDNIANNAGTFRLFGNSTLWRYSSKGSSLVSGTASPYNAPVTSILTGTSDISADQLTIRVDGVDKESVTTNQGTGNYGNYVLNMGARNNGAAQPLTGDIYGLIVRNVVSNAADIAFTEAYLAAKSGITL